MVLAIHSDTSYLSESKVRGREEGEFFMFNNVLFSRNNGSVSPIAQVIQGVMLSVVEAGLDALFINDRHAVPMQHT